MVSFDLLGRMFRVDDMSLYPNFVWPCDLVEIAIADLSVILVFEYFKATV